MRGQAFLSICFAATLCVAVVGCGSTKNRLATDQLLASDAVDRAVSKIDFRVLSGQSVYLDTNYLKTDAKRSIGYVDGDYVTSSLRQQILAAGCYLKDSAADAEYIIEARMGALGIDDREVVYGLPASNALQAAASAAAAFSTGPATMPTIPEISIARREDHAAAAKVSCFAYHRETREPVWQSGLAVSRSKAKDTYVFGAGPFQKGEIYNGVRFAGDDIKATFIPYRPGRRPAEQIELSRAHIFHDPLEIQQKLDDEIVPAGHEAPVEAKSEDVK